MKFRQFESFLREYAKSMNSENTLSLFKSEKLVKGNSRFLSLFTFYLWFNDKASMTLKKNKELCKTLYSSYLDVQQKYPGLNKENVESYVNRLDSFDELKKLYTSYKSLSLDFKVKQKSILYQEIQTVMKQKKITKYQIYSHLHLNPGNTNDFLKNHNLKKLSVEKIKKIHSFCRES
jgi:hypothetical protein